VAGDQHSDGTAGGAAGGGRTLADRLAAAGVSDRAEPWDAWRQLREPSYVPPLQAIGLVLRSRDELHRFLRPPAGQPHEVHVHVCAAGGQWERDHLLFRDYLRAHPAACLRYAEAKRASVRRWSDDGWAYTEAKTGVILDVLAQAEDWAVATNRRFDTDVDRNPISQADVNGIMGT
jgi:GrpB-like predicted nucleotidyltransferase (UPF0157 family)